MSLKTYFEEVLPLTCGLRNGETGYMTNPSTGHRFTPEEFKQTVNIVSKNYDFGPNIYLANDTHSYDVKG